MASSGVSALLARLLLFLCLLPAPGGRSAAQSDAEVEDDAPIRLLMSKEELEVYALLGDARARLEFLREFWEKRDPTPDTAENEFADEFQRRIEFSNRWFREGGKEGWRSERGRILLMLGFPDRRERLPMLDQPRIKAAEIWSYQAHALRLEFVDPEGLGRFRLRGWPLELLDAIARVQALGGAAPGSSLRIRLRAVPTGLRIEVPLKEIAIEERGGFLSASFAVSVDVYRDSLKLKRLRLRPRFEEERAALLARARILIDVPYAYSAPGRYLLDVIVEDRGSGRRARAFARYRKRR